MDQHYLPSITFSYCRIQKLISRRGGVGGGDDFGGVTFNLKKSLLSVPNKKKNLRNRDFGGI